MRITWPSLHRPTPARSGIRSLLAGVMAASTLGLIASATALTGAGTAAASTVVAAGATADVAGQPVPFGSALFEGAPATALGAPVITMASTNSGAGYWLVASDGGVFNYGDAQFFGSLGGTGVTDAAGVSTGI